MYFESQHYAYLWNKYRPVILKLMISADKDPQQYKLSGHEFKAIGRREKAGFSFSVEISDGKIMNNVKDATVARDLLHVLQQSQKATELMKLSVYEFRMDKQFVLHVSRKVETPPQEVVTEVANVSE
jgi:hypothetical protein